MTRKLYALLKQKESLSTEQRKEISLSLSKEVSGGSVEEVVASMKWVEMSPETTIANFYQNWSSLQG